MDNGRVEDEGEGGREIQRTREVTVMPTSEEHAFVELQVAGGHGYIGSLSQIAEDEKEDTGQRKRTLQLKWAG